MRWFAEIAHTGLDAVLLYPGRSLVTTLALVAVLLPYLACLGLAKGIEQQAQVAVRSGPDVYVTGKQFGRTVPVPLDVASTLGQIEGVVSVTPRIVGSIVLGKDAEPVVLVGLPVDRLPTTVQCVEGRLFEPGKMNEFVVGTELADRLKLKVGALIPPFYHSDRGERVSRVVGVFRSDVSLWQARLILTSLETAAEIFNQPGWVTDLLVHCRPGYESNIRTAIVRGSRSPAHDAGSVRLEAIIRADLEARLPQGLLHREGVFNALFVLAFAVGIGVVLVTAGFGLSERRREIAILKATGWQTDEVLLRGTVESLVLSISGAALSLVLAFVWLRWLNGLGIAGVFLAGVGAVPTFQVPSRLTPVPALLAFLISFSVVMSGTLYSSWRAATTPPREAMR